MRPRTMISLARSTGVAGFAGFAAIAGPASFGCVSTGASASTTRATSTGADAGSSGSSGASLDSGSSSNGPGSSSDGGTVCPLPTTFQWTSTGPLAQPKSGWVSLKDFSDIVYNNQHMVYMSTVDTQGSYGGAMMTFADWPQMTAATQYALPYGGVAPTLIYFTPKNIWVLMYEWGPWSFTYLTSTDPTNPSGWSSAYDLYQGPSIDETVLCTSSTCYLFFANDNGSIYR